MGFGRKKLARRRSPSVSSMLIVCGVAAMVQTAHGATFVARRTHGGLAIDLSGSAGTLVANGWLRRSGEPEYVYRTGGRIVAGIWTTGPDAAVVRSGVTESAPVIGRIVPSWNDNALSLAIEPAAGDPVRTGAFERENGAGLSTLSRNARCRSLTAR